VALSLGATSSSEGVVSLGRVGDLRETCVVALEIVTGSERSDLDGEAEAAFRVLWPEFIFHDPISREYMDRVDAYFADFAFFLLDEGRVAAGGWGVPFVWDGTPEGLPEGYRTAMVASVEDRESKRPVNAFCFMGAAVARDYDGRGLGAEVLSALTDRAREAGLGQVVAPIRPTWKHKYPLVSMADYATWSREDGLSIDPWIRTHQRMGASIVKPAPNSIVVSASVAEWEGWAAMPFPVSGAYVVPRALNLVEVDRESDRAVYREDNLWVRHS
jgi:GNAT superfamily N-acetyltransferase